MEEGKEDEEDSRVLDNRWRRCGGGGAGADSSINQCTDPCDPRFFRLRTVRTFPQSMIMLYIV